MKALKKWQDWEKMEARLDAYCDKLNKEYERLVKEKGVRSIEATAAFYTYIGALEACGEMIAIYWGLEE